MKKRAVLRSPVFQAIRSPEDVLTLVWDNYPDNPGMYEIEQAFKLARGMGRRTMDHVVRSLPSPRKYLHEHPTEFTWAPLVLEFGKEYRARESPTPWKMLKYGQCYENAVQVARESGGRIRYVEGLCIAPFAVMLHGWNVKDGLVIDRTWPMAHFNRYFGVTFSLAFLDRVGLPNGGVFCRWDPARDYLQRAAR